MLETRHTQTETHYSLQPSEAIQGCIETLEQGHQLLYTITDQQYCYAAPPHISSTVGEHFRHLLDLFQAIYQANDKIDYNSRRRGNIVETSRETAITEINDIINWLIRLSPADIMETVTLLTEVSISQTKVCEMASTLERELTFSALHATHHFAMVKAVLSLNNVGVDEAIGYAPATTSYLRGE